MVARDGFVEMQTREHSLKAGGTRTPYAPLSRAWSCQSRRGPILTLLALDSRERFRDVEVVVLMTSCERARWVLSQRRCVCVAA